MNILTPTERYNRRMTPEQSYMTPEQQALIETVQNDLRMAIDSLREPHVAGLGSVPEARENLLKAQEALDEMLLQRGTPRAKEEIVNRMIRDIALEDSRR